MQTGYDPAVRSGLIGAVTSLVGSGSTALFAAVNHAIDDLHCLPEANCIPVVYLVVLSDGEDNQGTNRRYAGSSGVQGLAARVHDWRGAGALHYLPIAYGQRNESLNQVGGEGFRVDKTSLGEIAGRFGEIRRSVMVGLPGGAQ